jgi:L-threonylcarbamoyladenylate synthase
MELVQPTEENLDRAGACIARGGLVVFPTETVYGLGADAFNARAVASVFEAKARPTFDPLIVHVASMDGVGRVASSVPVKARELMERLWPGPLTLILPKRDEIPDLATSGLPTVAVRCPAHPVGRAIIERSGTAVVGPSANPFGYLSPTRAQHVARMLGDRVDLIVDGGPCRIGVESTVLDMTVDPPRLLRPGGMEREAIEAVIGPIALRAAGGPSPSAPGAKRTPAVPGAQVSPGQLDSHYAPRTPLHLVQAGGLAAAAPGGRAVAIVLDAASAERLGSAAGRYSELRILSPSGDLLEAAASLFALLHELDGLGYDEIWAERVPERGLGPAINDRLYRASAK